IRPSPSASNAATPEPIVSGIHFFPAAPFTCVNATPEAFVTSSNRIEETARVGSGAGVGETGFVSGFLQAVAENTDARRKAKRGRKCLRRLMGRNRIRMIRPVKKTGTVRHHEEVHSSPVRHGNPALRVLRPPRRRTRTARGAEAAFASGRGSDTLCGGALGRSFEGDVQGKGGDSDFPEKGIRHALAEREGARDRIGVGLAGDRSEGRDSGRGVGRGHGLRPCSLSKKSSSGRIRRDARLYG